MKSSGMIGHLTRSEPKTPSNDSIRYIEPAAILAFLQLLRSDDATLFAGSFNPHPKPRPNDDDYHPNSFDGLAGLRIARQSIQGLLKSSLQIYDLFKGRIVPHLGHDSLRLRMQIGEFDQKRSNVVGFSWSTRRNKNGEIEIYSDPYVTSDPKKATHQATHALMKFADVTPCGFAEHCNNCHHRDRLNLFSDEERNTPPIQSEAFADFLEEAKNQGQVSEKQVDELLNSRQAPTEMFSNTALEKALIARWYQLQRSNRVGTDYLKTSAGQ